MKIAIPLFQERVSPHFGSSCEVLIVETKGVSYQEGIYKLQGQTPMKLAQGLLGLEVEMIICGGIQKYWREWLIQKGMKVLDNQSGSARTIVKDLIKKGNPKKQGG